MWILIPLGYLALIVLLLYVSNSKIDLRDELKKSKEINTLANEINVLVNDASKEAKARQDTIDSRLREEFYKGYNSGQKWATDDFFRRMKLILPQLAILKQFYIKSPELRERIERSVRMTKEEFITMFPDKYEYLFDTADFKQGQSFLPNDKILRNAKKIMELLDSVDTGELEYRDAYASQYADVSSKEAFMERRAGIKKVSYDPKSE